MARPVFLLLRLVGLAKRFIVFGRICLPAANRLQCLLASPAIFIVPSFASPPKNQKFKSAMKRDGRRSLDIGAEPEAHKKPHQRHGGGRKWDSGSP